MAAPTQRQETGTAGGPAGGFFLLVLGPEYSVTRTLPVSGMLTIGRGEDADVRVVDALASRAHARLHIGESVQIEDLGSYNGTRLRDKPLSPGDRVALEAGEAITIGTTILIVQRRDPALHPRRIWPHGYFETRLIEACAQAESVRGSFALVRLQVGSDAPAAEQVLAGAMRPGDVFASYAPGDYEILLLDTDADRARALADDLVAQLSPAGGAPRAGLAFFPGDGNAPEALVSRAAERLLGAAPGHPAAGAIVVESATMKALYAMGEKVARGNINVLVLGETGVGKEILAESIHRLSPRAGGPFVCLNCAALSETLLESELFGHEKGAFTGAVQPKIGLIEASSGGTLFLDEVGEMPLLVQAKLLRSIESGEVMRVGSTRTRPVDVRLVAATNRDLDEEVAARRFREDLFFRLNGVTLTIPPLRERPEEILPLARLFLERSARQLNQPPPSLSAAALAELAAYSWPGNIRELRNMMERAVLLATPGSIRPEHLSIEKMRRSSQPPGGAEPAARRETSGPAPAPSTLVALERQAILDALVRCAGNQTRAAELLGMPRRTFCKKLGDHNIPRPRT